VFPTEVAANTSFAVNGIATLAATSVSGNGDRSERKSQEVNIKGANNNKVMGNRFAQAAVQGIVFVTLFFGMSRDYGMMATYLK